MHPQREFAVEVVERLRGAGYVAYWAGGCVRDELLGRLPKDYDVATNATPHQVMEVFGRRHTIAVGVSFGVIIVRGPRAAGQLDVATFREDQGYSDGRRPDAVCFSTPERDAQRRDFTINGLFFDPLENKVLDFVGGEADLKRGIVRAIGVAQERFTEDKLRMLRGVRFTAVFGFELEDRTRAAIEQMAAEILVVSPERIGMELRSMWLHAQRNLALLLLYELGLLRHILPELAELATSDPARWQEMLDVLKRLEDPTPALALAALLLPLRNAELPMEMARRLRWTNKEGERAAWLLEHVPRLANIDSQPWPQAQRLLIEEGMPELLALHRAITAVDNAQVRWCEEKLSLPAETLNPKPLVTGGDLRQAGLSPGPEFKTLLDAIRDAQLMGEIQSHEQAIELAKEYLRNK